MTSTFNWEEFEESEPVKSKFSWDQFEEAPSSKGDIKFPGLGIGKKTKADSKVELMKQELGKKAKVIGSSIAGIPGDLKEAAESLPKYLLEKIS